jgi:hypothetical protein
VHSGLVVDIGSRGGVHAGNDIITWRYRPGKNQAWQFDAATKTIMCPPYNLVLEVRNLAVNSGVMAAVPDGSSKQKWCIFSVNPPTVKYRPHVPKAVSPVSAPAAPAPQEVLAGVPWQHGYYVWFPGTSGRGAMGGPGPAGTGGWSGGGPSPPGPAFAPAFLPGGPPGSTGSAEWYGGGRFPPGTAFVPGAFDTSGAGLTPVNAAALGAGAPPDMDRGGMEFGAPTVSASDRIAPDDVVKPALP